MTHVAVVLGTRPEMIKLSEICRLLDGAVSIVHTGQHYDDVLMEHVRARLGFGMPDVVLGVGGATRGRQIGEAVAALDEQFGRERPDVVVVQGDTNAAVAGALAANAREIPLVHVEAGLRSFDRRMPEEHNRVLIDHVADLCCAPTETSAANLAAESIDGARVTVTGNPIVEVAARLVPDRDARSAVIAALGLESDAFVVATIHRPENTDDTDRLAMLLEQLGGLPVPVLLPIHPRTAARVASSGLDRLLEPLVVVDPLDPVTFLAVAAEAAVWVTDSGGLQEEASVLKRPVVVVRRSTERPEVLGTFADLVTAPSALADRTGAWLADTARRSALARLASPFGDGRASARIAELVLALASA